MAVNLQKGQKISLNKEAGSALTQVVMGLGWTPPKRRGFWVLAAAAKTWTWTLRA